MKNTVQKIQQIFYCNVSKHVNKKGRNDRKQVFYTNSNEEKREKRNT